MRLLVLRAWSRVEPPAEPPSAPGPVPQGLYKADERFGPGVETYPDGSQDVGLWFRRDLVRLCMDIPGSFSVRSYPEFAGFLGRPAARISLADDETMRWDPHEERDPFFYDYKRFLLDDSLTSPPGMYIYSTDSAHLPMTRSLREDLDAWVFQQDIPPFVEDGDPWFIKNETPLLVKIQKQAYKFRYWARPARGLHPADSPGAWLSGLGVRQVTVNRLPFSTEWRPPHPCQGRPLGQDMRPECGRAEGAGRGGVPGSRWQVLGEQGAGHDGGQGVMGSAGAAGARELGAGGVLWRVC